MSVLKPPRLKKHDVIGIVAPASAPSTVKKIERGIQYLEHLGYRVELGKHTRDVHGYFAGRDSDRVSDLNAMFANKHVKAIIVVRGGYGTPRLLGQINYPLIKRNPKILVGYSDITALQLAIYAKTRLVTFSGPMLAVEMIEKMDSFTEEFFWKLLTSPHPIGKVLNPDGRPLKALLSPPKKSRAPGRLLGGNLSMIISLMGTPFQPNMINHILFFEEVSEEPYRIDRMLTQLKLAGVFRKVRAIIIGSFTDCVPLDKTKPTLTIDELLEEITEDLDIPILSGLAYGHIPRKLTLPLGLKVKIDSRLGTLELLESPVR